jgi:biopolymer transport protein ExbD
MLQRRNRYNRLSTEINAGSMADIAFLLLIFFLVTSQIGSDRGLLVKLPPLDSPSQQDDAVEPRNMLEIILQADGSLKLRDKMVKLEDLNGEVKNFILNPSQDPNNAVSPEKAAISFLHDSNTAYEYFINVYNELQESYYEIRNDLAQKKYGKDIKSLSEAEKESIRVAIPIAISEDIIQ